MPASNHMATWSAPKFPYFSDRAATPLELEDWRYMHDAWRRAYNTCATCGSSKTEVRNFDRMWGDGDVYCENDHYVRMYDTG